MLRNKNRPPQSFTLILKHSDMTLRSKEGFTLIEILVVVAIIALLSSVIAISVMSAKQKGRDVRRLTDMTQMNTGLELFFASYKGYPTGTSGIPQDISPYVIKIPTAPTPGDGVCETLVHNNDECTVADPNCTGKVQNQYYYVASGTPYTISGRTVYPDYAYFFCLGNKTGNFLAGPRILTPKGVR